MMSGITHRWLRRRIWIGSDYRFCFVDWPAIFCYTDRETAGLVSVKSEFVMRMVIYYDEVIWGFLYKMQ